VERSSQALTVPFRSTWTNTLHVEGIDSVRKLVEFTLQAGNAGLLATLGTRILRGRDISEDDRANAPHVVVVGKSMGERLWPNQDAMGKCIRLGSDTAPCMTVVGIAEDVRRRKL